MPSLPTTLVSIALLLFLGPVQARVAGPFLRTGPESIELLGWEPEEYRPSVQETRERVPENARLVSSTLAVLLGPFAAHRIYLGTTPKVAIIYGVTFGGFGVLALIDLGHLLFTKDLAPYRNSDRVFMWSVPKGGATPP